MCSNSLAWFQCTENNFENDRHLYLWVIIEEADIYHRGKSSNSLYTNKWRLVHRYIYAQVVVFFTHLIEKLNRIK